MKANNRLSSCSGQPQFVRDFQFDLPEPLHHTPTALRKQAARDCKLNKQAGRCTGGWWRCVLSKARSTLSPRQHRLAANERNHRAEPAWGDCATELPGLGIIAIKAVQIRAFRAFSLVPTNTLILSEGWIALKSSSIFVRYRQISATVVPASVGLLVTNTAESLSSAVWRPGRSLLARRAGLIRRGSH